ncbi:hypothetical protein N8381_03230 [Oceanospirillaceae bacterium]|nr:hypothetical protein [Oceanospirillaceae bacterium]
MLIIIYEHKKDTMIKISMLAQWFNRFVVSFMQNVLLGLDALLDDLAASVFFISLIYVPSLPSQ